MKPITLSFLLLYSSAIGQPLPPSEPYWSNTVTSASIKLAWDPSPDEGIASYRIHMGQASGSYNTQFNAGTNLEYTVTNVPVSGTNAITNFFAATAIGTNQMESDFSNEVMWGTPERPVPPAMKEILMITPEIEASTNLSSWFPVGNLQEFAFLPPKGWEDEGVLRVKLSFRTVPATHEPTP